MKAIIAGSRNYTLNSSQYISILKICKVHGVTEIVSGGASGVDTCGEAFAKRYGYKLKTFPAQWNKYGKSAGPIRNGQMAQYADVCILFPGGAGTEHMRQSAIGNGLIIYYVGHNGDYTT